MKSETLKQITATITIMLLFIFGISLLAQPMNVLGASVAQATDIVPTVVVTAVIPGTGADASPTVWSSWIFWVIVGAILLAAIMALIARAATPTVDHYHDHNDDL